MSLAGDESFVLRDDLIIEEIDGEVVVLDLAGNQYFGLNEVAFLIWEVIDEEQATLDEIVAEIVDSFDVSEDEARADASAYIGQLLDAGLATRQSVEGE